MAHLIMSDKVYQLIHIMPQIILYESFPILLVLEIILKE